jgi:hypothetical protein
MGNDFYFLPADRCLYDKGPPNVQATEAAPASAASDSDPGEREEASADSGGDPKINRSDLFVIHRLRAKPVEYTVKIRHFVERNEWMIGVIVCDIEENERGRLSVADDLRRCAEMLEDRELTTTPEPK